MSNDPWSGARLGTNDDSPLGGAFLAEAVNELGKWVAPGFATKADRDAALAAWQANGNTAQDGMQCSVAGRAQVYRAGTWRGLTSQLYTTSVTDTARHTTTTAIMSLTVPDPGFSYSLLGHASSSIASIENSVSVAMRVRVNGTDLPGVGGDWVNNSGGTLTNGLIANTASPSGVLTGAALVQAVVWMTGINGWTAASNPLYNQLTALVVPA